MTNQCSVCFIAINAYPVLKKNNTFIGGAELQQSLIGVELARRGHPIKFITMDHGQGPFEKLGQIDVFSTFKPKQSANNIFSLFTKYLKIWMAMEKANADILYVRCAGYVLAIAVIWARLKKRKAVYCCANDPEFDPQKVKLPTLRDKHMFSWGLRNCDAIIVQNALQRSILKQYYNRVGVLIPNGFPASEQMASPENILWVATFKKAKQPHLFIELAKRHPEQKFVMVGGPVSNNGADYTSLKNEASQISNLRFCGPLSFEDAEKEFSKAKILVNTSSNEGFPNTFLQAWRKGVPVLAFLDPDDRIRDNKLGYVAKNFDDMNNKLDSFLQNDEISSKIISDFFQKNLTIESIVSQYQVFFNTLIKP